MAILIGAVGTGCIWVGISKNRNTADEPLRVPAWQGSEATFAGWHTGQRTWHEKLISAPARPKDQCAQSTENKPLIASSLALMKCRYLLKLSVVLEALCLQFLIGRCLRLGPRPNGSRHIAGSEVWGIGFIFYWFGTPWMSGSNLHEHQRFTTVRTMDGEAVH